jgi:hypothetical protein
MSTITFSEFMREEGGDPSYGRVVRKKDWHEPVKKILGRVDLDVLRQSELKRVEERDAEHKLALQLIDIGYKTLATKLHPDKGGSRDAMARLNRVRDRLKMHAVQKDDGLAVAARRQVMTARSQFGQLGNGSGNGCRCKNFVLARLNRAPFLKLEFAIGSWVRKPPNAAHWVSSRTCATSTRCRLCCKRRRGGDGLPKQAIIVSEVPGFFRSIFPHPDLI